MTGLKNTARSNSLLDWAAVASARLGRKFRLARVRTMVVDRPLERIKREFGIASILTLTLVSLVAVLMAMITMLDIRRERTSFYDNVEKRGAFLRHGLTDVFADHLYHGRFAELASVSDRVVAGLPDIESIRIFSSDGNVIIDRHG